MSHMHRTEQKQGLGSGTQGYAGITGHSDYGPDFEQQFRILTLGVHCGEGKLFFTSASRWLRE